MRIVWLAPWFRTLAVAWADALRERGHEVLLVTNEMHFDAPPVGATDVVLQHPWRSLEGVREGWQAACRVRRFRPEVVVTEEARDPRFLALAQLGGPIVFQTHDHQAHDDANARAAMARATRAVLDRRCALEITFSEFVAEHRRGQGHPVEVVPLTSEMDERLTPPLVDASARRDFLAIGRMSAYKNIPLVVEAYRLHQQSQAYRGDRLVLVGSGDPGCALPPDVEHVDERFRFEDLAPRLAAAKASLVMYSAGSQSGVQVIDMQCGVRSLVSDVAGFEEYLPPGEVALPLGDPATLARALDELADPARAAADGRRNAEHYARRFSAAAGAARWEKLLLSVVSG